MRKSHWMMALPLLVMAFGAPAAHADSLIEGNIQFMVTGGNVPVAPTGSFVYDGTTNLFTSFLIIWNDPFPDHFP